MSSDLNSYVFEDGSPVPPDAVREALGIESDVVVTEVPAGSRRARRPMVNPRMLNATRKRIPDLNIGGGKWYQPFLGKRTRRAFFRASEAQAYADRCKARWIRLYDAAIVAMATADLASPTNTNGTLVVR